MVGTHIAVGKEGQRQNLEDKQNQVADKSECCLLRT